MWKKLKKNHLKCFSSYIPLNGQSLVGFREINGSCSSFVYWRTRSALVKSWNDSIICLIPYWTIPVRISDCEMAKPTLELVVLAWFTMIKLKQTQATKAHDTQSSQSPKAIINHTSRGEKVLGFCVELFHFLLVFPGSSFIALQHSPVLTLISICQTLEWTFWRLSNSSVNRSLALLARIVEMPVRVAAIWLNTGLLAVWTDERKSYEDELWDLLISNVN
jgi:hypothetical protein